MPSSNSDKYDSSGKRQILVDLFEEEFIDSQELLGMEIVEASKRSSRFSDPRSHLL